MSTRAPRSAAAPRGGATDDDVALWQTAAALDPTLTVRARDWPALLRKRLRSEPSSRAGLFSRMAAGRPVVFSDFPVVVSKPLVELIRTGFPRSQTARVQMGPSRRRGHLPVPELMRRWAAGRARVSVTDLHIRGTRLEQAIDVGSLSDFNLLIRGSEAMAYQEMMTLVISSRGNVTDSHSDDPDGSNHCFTGRKLWLAWETFAGRARGLQDVERDEVEGQAAFDLRTFLSVPGSRWFTVSTDETLFLPGKLTHKVVTLEPYIGVGSFYVALPSCLETLIRWNLRGPLWSLADPDGERAGLVDEITRTVSRKVRALQRASPAARERWGLGHLRAAVERLDRGGRQPARLAKNPAFAELLETVRSVPAAA